MAKNTDRSTLGYLGEEFQIKLIKCFFEDRKFFTSLVHIIDQNMFTNEYLRTIVGILKDRYNKKDVVATYSEIDTLLRVEITNNVRLQYCLEMLKLIETTELTGIDIIEEESEKFFKQQNLTRAINKAQDIIKKGDFKQYYAIEDMIKKALEVNTKCEFGWQLFDNIENDLREDYRETIPTGTPELDEALYGGLGRGELGIIVAPSGVGKTSICTGFSVAAALDKSRANNYSGFKVLHFFFEDPDESIRRKYYGNLLDIDAMVLSDPNVRPHAIEKLKQMKETDEYKQFKQNIRGERLPSGETTASDIRRKIDAYIARGFKPDLVIIDYFECLKPERESGFNDSEWSKEGVTMRKLESICNEKKIAMWVPVQGTKGSIGADFVGLMHAGGSVSKVQIGHVILTLARTDEQKSQQRLNVFIQKLRAVKIGRDKFLNVKFNNGTGKFDMSDMDDMDNAAYEVNTQSRQNALAKQVRDNRRKNNI